MQWFINLKIKNKIFSIFTMLLIFLAILGVGSLYSLYKLNETNNLISHNLMKKTVAINNIIVSIYDIRRAHLRHLLSNDIKEKKLQEINSDSLISKYKIYLFEYTSSISQKNSNEIVIINKAKMQQDNYMLSSKELIIQSRLNNNHLTETILIDKTVIEFDKVIELLKQCIELNKIQSDIAILNSNSAYSNAESTLLILYIIISIFIFTLGNYLSNQISKPIIELSEIAKKISVGSNNVHINIYQNNEVGELANSFRDLVSYFHNIADGMNLMAEGNFTSKLTPLSEDDILGIALVKTNSQLLELYKSINDLNTVLEIKISERTIELHESLKNIKYLNKLSDNALELTKAGTWEIDLTNQEWFISSERTARIFGDIPNENYKYKFENWNECVKAGNSEFAEKALEIFEDSITGKIPKYDAVYAYKRPIDGEIVWIHAIGEIESNSEGTPIKMFGVIQDITDFKLTEFALEQTKESADKIVDTTQIPTLVYALSDGHIVRANAAMADFHLMEVEKLKNMFIIDSYVNEEDKTKVIDILKKEGVLKNYDLQLKRFSNGEIRDCIISLIPISYNNLDCLVGSIIDITDIKKIQSELANAKEVAESATKAKSDFLANMSHEIRTPMNAIIGLSHLALKSELTPKTKDYLTKIERSSLTLLNIINDILDFSKIEAGKLKIDNIEFDLDNVFETVSNLVALKAQEKGLELIFDIDPQLPYNLIGDPLRIGQVITNLTSNALKFTNEGQIVISAKLLETYKDYYILQFAVQDSGIGLNEEQKNKLFQAFSQADESTTRKYGGTGLGLTISKKFVEMMEGKIWVESEPNVGSTFIFTAKLGKPNEERMKDFVPSLDLRGMKVLVCDDNETSREMLSEALTLFTFDVTTVVSGKEAIEILESHKEIPFELVLMDWKMPDLDGIQTSKLIKNNLNIPHTPIIIMVTAYVREEVNKMVEEAGLDGFLLKPINYSILFDTIMQLFGKDIKPESKHQIKELEHLKKYEKFKVSKILLVEDNEINQQIASELLESVGLEVEIAQNGAIALEKVKNSGIPSKYDVVLMDLLMPVMDGYTATKEIRKLDNYKTLPIIAMTADAMMGVREKCIEAGMTDFITKPINPDEVFSTISKWIVIKKEKTFLAKKNENNIKDEIVIPKLEFINTIEGIRRVANNKKLYLKLLKDFKNNYSNFVNELKSLVKNDKIEDSIRAAHTLKGVSGNIGANALQLVADNMELILKIPNNELFDETIIDLETELNKVINDLNFIEEKKSLVSDESLNDLDKNKFKYLLNEIIQLLKDDDFDASSKLNEILELETIGKLNEEIKKITSKVQNYDFVNALDLSEELLNKISRDLS